MKTAAKYGFWLIAADLALFIIFIICVTIFETIHKGLYNIFISFCCNDGFNTLEIARGALLLIMFNLIFWLIIILQIEQQETHH